MTTSEARRQSGGRLMIGCILVGLVALGACGAGRAAGAGKLIASPEADWPQWRGPRRDAVSSETGLLDAWPAGGPKLLWKIDSLGKGWSSPIIVGPTLYITGDVGERLEIFAFDLDGKLKWKTPNGKAWKKPWGGARAACCYSDGKIYHMNAYGRVVCLDATDGKEQWSVDVLRRFQAEQLRFGLSECLLVDGDRVIVTPGSRTALIAALDKKTGKTVWTATAPPEATETAGYSSPILLTWGKTRQIIAITSFRTLAVNADTGKTLWSAGLALTNNACSTIPVLCDDLVLATNTSVDKQATSMLKPAPSGLASENIWTNELRTLSGSAVYVDGNLYVAGARGFKGFFCLDPKTGKARAVLPEPSTAAMVYADHKLFVLSGDDGKVLLLKPAANGFETKGQFKLVEKVKKDAWAHPVLLRGRLYLRYHDALFCYDVKAQ